MTSPHFITGYLPFWIITYGLAVVLWSCVGRFMLAWLVPAIQPSNYIWRAFVALTEFAIRAIGWITPRYVRTGLLPLVTAFWLYWIKLALGLAMLQAGWAPSLSQQAAGG